MLEYIIRRVVHALVVVLGVTIIVFILIHTLPGGEARAELGARATPARVAAFNHANGLDKPLPLQYVIYVGKLARGDLGFSYAQEQSIGSLLATNLPKTLFLMALSYGLALLIALPLAVYQAVRRNKPDDYVLTALSFILYSMPVFWLALLLIIPFAVDWKLLPPNAPHGGLGTVITHPAGLVLPVVTLALVTVAWFSRYLRSSVMENLVQDYVRTARAQGLSRREVLVHHVLRNSLLPVITLLGIALPWLFSGALVIEVIFNYPGMGLLFWNAAQSQDYPVLLGTVIVVGFATAMGSLVADLLYLVVDPRVKYGFKYSVKQG